MYHIIKIIIYNTNTKQDDEQKQIILEIVLNSFKEFKSKTSQLSTDIKLKLDEKLGSPWHIIVGKSFSSSISHEKNGFIYIYLENLAILCFKTA